MVRGWGQGGDAEAAAPVAPSTAAKYDKDDFFDTMSCEALERLKLAEAQEDGAPRIDGRARAAGQRKVRLPPALSVHAGVPPSCLRPTHSIAGAFCNSCGTCRAGTASGVARGGRHFFWIFQATIAQRCIPLFHAVGHRVALALTASWHAAQKRFDPSLHRLRCVSPSQHRSDARGGWWTGRHGDLRGGAPGGPLWRSAKQAWLRRPRIGDPSLFITDTEPAITCGVFKRPAGVWLTGRLVCAL